MDICLLSLSLCNYSKQYESQTEVIAKQPEDNFHCLVTKKLDIHENVGVFHQKQKLTSINYHFEYFKQDYG